MKTRLLLASALCAAVPAFAQTFGCDSPESRQLDFWVGEWELSHTDEGKRVTSRNRITKSLDGCAVMKEFTGAPGTKLDGRSFSVFDRLSGKWRQTWVDNTAAYLDFEGGIVDGQMSFWREGKREGKVVRQRMVFRDVKANSLTWLWQSSLDDGRNWKTLWEIEYRRLK